MTSIIAALLLGWGGAFSSTFAQELPPNPQPSASVQANARERQAALVALATQLERSYLTPAVGRRYSDLIRQHLRDGTYDRLTDPSQFAAQVTAELQSVSADEHLKFAAKEEFERRLPPKPGAALSARAKGPPGLEEARMIGNVAYLRFNMFPDSPSEIQRVRSFLVDHADARALIIDSRPNRGGGMQTIDALLPLLYAKKTVLAEMETRAAVADAGFRGATLIPVAAPPDFVRVKHVVEPAQDERRLQRVPVFYLTSSRTGSAAEYLAFALQRTKRAVVVGERTVGAAHFGSVVPIGESYAAFIPIGRAFDPTTGRDWEGVGVSPDIQAPADDALDTALRMVPARH